MNSAMIGWTKSKQWLLVVLIASVVAVFCISGGYHGETVCAVKSPHDGQCGLSVMGGYLAAIVLFPGTLALGGIAIGWINSRRKS
jgi:hypothetical protein